MKKIINLLTIISQIILIEGCANYVERIHDQIDRESNQGKYKKVDQFEMYRPKNSIADIKNKKNKIRAAQAGSNISSEDQPVLSPAVKRQYLPQEVVKKRFTADDLTDSKAENSLWVAQDSNAFLFSEETKKRNGDIITINVQTALKSDISLALKKAYPDINKPKAPAEKENADPNAAKKETAEAKPAAPSAEQDQIFDKISGIVIEEINRDHLLVRGRKAVLYKGNKRNIEVQGLLARKDVDQDDAVSSDKILESTVSVVR